MSFSLQAPPSAPTHKDTQAHNQLCVHFSKYNSPFYVRIQPLQTMTRIYINKTQVESMRTGSRGSVAVQLNITVGMWACWCQTNSRPRRDFNAQWCVEVLESAIFIFKQARSAAVHKGRLTRGKRV